MTLLSVSFRLMSEQGGLPGFRDNGIMRRCTAASGNGRGRLRPVLSRRRQNGPAGSGKERTGRRVVACVSFASDAGVRAVGILMGTGARHVSRVLLLLEGVGTEKNRSPARRPSFWEEKTAEFSVAF